MTYMKHVTLMSLEAPAPLKRRTNRGLTCVPTHYPDVPTVVGTNAHQLAFSPAVFLEIWFKFGWKLDLWLVSRSAKETTPRLTSHIT